MTLSFSINASHTAKQCHCYSSPSTVTVAWYGGPFQSATIRPFAVNSIIDDRLPDNGAEAWLSDHLTWFPCSILSLEPQVERSNYRLSVLFVVIQLTDHIMPNFVTMRTLYEARER